MLVKEIMNKEVKTVRGQTSIKDAARSMNKFSIGSLIVVKDSQLIGIITERDILEKIVAEGKDPAKIIVKDIMTKDVILIKPSTDAQDAVDIMHKNKIKKLPVVLGNKVIGILTVSDLCAIQPKFVEKLSALFLFPRERKTVAG